ncbi:deoxyribodipyrimidine photo-lyase [Rubrivirga sp. IMCC43871]|uniref:deoxyribodipyrimidine photo-lyase n=1 Tax=Rubrivirga sp. IMCC43871 TaxID=3391575 RepID=UPI00398FCBFC
MTALDALRLRTRRLSDPPVADAADYVLCWLGQALRADHNPVIDASLALGDTLGLPVVVLHTLENRYPYASHRIHRFMLEASQELGPGVEARGLRFARYVRQGEPGGDAPGAVDVAARLAKRAAAVFTNDVPTFVAGEYSAMLAARLEGRAVFAVDACCAVPMNAFETHLETTKAFRAAHSKLRPGHLTLDLTQPGTGHYDGDLDLPETPDLTDWDGRALDAFIAGCGVDLSVPPAPGWSGRRSAALERLTHAVEHVVPRYKWTRNNPALDDATTKLSPWLHFGVLSPREVAVAVLDAEAEGHVHSAARWKFLDELLTWREVYHHRCRWESWSHWDGLPAWARETLLAHADDPRPTLYSLDELAHGETDDDVWNAAQKQFAIDGWMNNNLRMYWGRQLLKWRPHPADAFAATCYLNDRFSLDGRNASTYGGIRSGFGEVRPWKERPVYGTVAGKTSGALMKRPGVPAWIAEQAGREVPFRASIPADPPPEFDRYR